MPSHLEQTHVLHVAVYVVVEQFLYPEGKTGIGKETAAGGTGVVLDLKHVSQLHLFLSGAAFYGQQFFPVNQTLFLRYGGFKVFCAQGPKHKTFQTRLSLYGLHGNLTLRHRPLPQHLPGYDKRRLYLPHVFPRHPEHVDAAVYAGIHVLAVAVFWLFDYLQKAVRYIEHLYWYTEGLGHLLSLGLTTVTAVAEAEDR